MDNNPTTDSPLRHPDLIIPRIYLCDLHTAQDAVVATSYGITHIISVLDFVPAFPDEMEHIKKLHVGLSDNFREKITPHLDETTTFIREALEGDSENKILVHCFMGISRSATVVCAYLIAEQGMTAPAAIDFVRVKRPIVCPNIGFRRQLGEYAVKLHGETKEDVEAQKKLGKVPKRIKLWMRGVRNKEIESDASAIGACATYENT